MLVLNAPLFGNLCCWRLRACISAGSLASCWNHFDKIWALFSVSKDAEKMKNMRTRKTVLVLSKHSWSAHLMNESAPWAAVAMRCVLKRIHWRSEEIPDARCGFLTSEILSPVQVFRTPFPGWWKCGKRLLWSWDFFHTAQAVEMHRVDMKPLWSSNFLKAAVFVYSIQIPVFKCVPDILLLKRAGV